MINQVKFGPAGADEAFANAGLSHSIEMPEFLKNKGLDLYEYSFGRGVRITKETANKIGEEANRCGIEISVHAPYFINFATTEDDKLINTFGYLNSSLDAVNWFGGNRVVFHPGSEGGKPRIEAFARCKDNFNKYLDSISNIEIYKNLIICPETMGKQAQIGTVEEIIELSRLACNVYPCIDFGHVNSLLGGVLKTSDDFQRIIDKMFDSLGEEKTKNMHVHFSKIQYGAKGEIKHLTFKDTQFGPNFEPFADVIIKNKLTPHIICESAGTQSDDSLFMKNVLIAKQ